MAMTGSEAPSRGWFQASSANLPNPRLRWPSGLKSGSKSTTYACALVRKAGGEWQAEGRETYPRIEEHHSCHPCQLSVPVCADGNILGWQLFCLATSSSWAPQWGSWGPALPLLCCVALNEAGGCVPTWVLECWDVGTSSSQTVESVFFHFNICSVPSEKRKIFIIMNKHIKKASYSFSQRAFFHFRTEIQEASERFSFLWWILSKGSSICVLYLLMLLGVWDGSHVSGQVCWHGGSGLLLEGWRGWNASINTAFHLKQLPAPQSCRLKSSRISDLLFIYFYFLLWFAAVFLYPDGQINCCHWTGVPEQWFLNSSCSLAVEWENIVLSLYSTHLLALLFNFFLGTQRICRYFCLFHEFSSCVIRLLRKLCISFT